VQLGDDAAETPHVDRCRVRQAENDLRRSVKARLYVRVHCRRNRHATLVLNGHVKTAEQRTIVQQTVISILAIDTLHYDTVTFGTARRSLYRLRPRPVPPRCAKCNSPPINGHVPTSYYSMWHYKYKAVFIKGLKLQ